MIVSIICTMAVCAVLGLIFYFLSVCPVKLEEKFGRKTFRLCYILRQASSVFLNIPFIGYIICVKYPAPAPFPSAFPWSTPVSYALGAIIVGLGLHFFINGRKTIGFESISPIRTQKLITTGIYSKIRHPQHLGELSFWFAFSFFLNSPFLLAVSFFWIPVYYTMCVGEEWDLLARFPEEYGDYRNDTGLMFPRILNK